MSHKKKGRFLTENQRNKNVTKSVQKSKQWPAFHSFISHGIHFGTLNFDMDFNPTHKNFDEWHPLFVAFNEGIFEGQRRIAERIKRELI